MKRVLLCAFALIVSGAASAVAQDRIVAVVNNEVITQKDLDGFTTFTRMQLSQKLEGQALEDKISSMKKDLIQRLIEDRLILQEAKKGGVKVDESRVKAKMSEVKKRYDTERAFSEALMAQGLSESDVESRIRDQMMMYALIDKKIREKIQITPPEITAYYEQHKQEMMYPERRELVSVSMEKEDAAKDLAAELRRGKDIEALAQERNLKVSTLTIRKGELKREVDDAVFSLGPGDITDPLAVNGAFYVFKLKQVIPPELRSLTEMQNELSDILFEKKMQEGVAAWLEDVKRTAYIRIMQ